MGAVIVSLAFTAIAAVAFLLSKTLDRRIGVASALAAAVYLGVDDFVTGLPPMFKGLDLVGEEWNWTGKLLSLALSAAVIAALRLRPDAVGLTLEQRHTRIGVVATLLFIVWGTCLGLLFKPGVPSTETLLFQATMPGLSEEIVYRGIAPAILLGLFHRKEPVDGIPWAVILATAVAFGAWHGVRYSDGALGFDVLSALFPFLGSIPGGWLRFRTGSLVFPILGHAVANVAFHVAGGLGA